MSFRGVSTNEDIREESLRFLPLTGWAEIVMLSAKRPVRWRTVQPGGVQSKLCPRRPLGHVSCIPIVHSEAPSPIGYSVFTSCRFELVSGPLFTYLSILVLTKPEFINGVTNRG